MEQVIEFNKKLQHLRKQNQMTQEQLSKKLNISRTAVSKWESGRGFPNIEALKNLASIFNVSIDQLLSGEELLDAAENENQLRRNKMIRFIYGIYDILMILFIFLPLYGKKIGDYIYSVNLLQLSGIGWLKPISFILFITIFLLGLIEVILHFFDLEKWNKPLRICSLLIHSSAVLFFTAIREPYVTTFIFLLLLAKAFILYRKL